MQTIVILSGAGISAESGLKTFRDADGLWEQHRIEDVCTHEAWCRQPDIVQAFYNERRKDMMAAQPNAAHKALVELEDHAEVHIITQNVDDLHERAGSKSVIHLHGELRKSRSSIDPERIYPIDGWEIKMGQCCDKGSQLRPHIVFFGEPVPMMDAAARIVAQADIIVVVGTSMAVYPAASLVSYAPKEARCYYVDPNPAPVQGMDVYALKATEGIPLLVHEFIKKSV